MTHRPATLWRVARPVAAADAEQGLHPAAPDARGSGARRHLPCCRCAALGLGLGLGLSLSLGHGHSRAQLAAGFAADFVAWDLDHPRALACWSCRNPCRRVVRAGIDTDLRDLR